MLVNIGKMSQTEKLSKKARSQDGKLGGCYILCSLASDMACQVAMPQSMISVLPQLLHLYSRMSRPEKVVFSVCSILPLQLGQVSSSISPHLCASYTRRDTR